MKSIDDDLEYNLGDFFLAKFFCRVFQLSYSKPQPGFLRIPY